MSLGAADAVGVVGQGKDAGVGVAGQQRGCSRNRVNRWQWW